jgi:hypothetical protein
VNFNPGEKWEYSNTAYDLLASIIEKVSGLSFREYMQKYIFRPLAMQHSLVYNTRRSSHEIVPDYAYGYVYSDSLKRFILPDSLPEYDYVIWADGIQGAGLINSTTGDLLKWDRALKNHKLLSETTNTEMLSPQSIMDTIAKKYYGYGVMLGRNEIGDYVMHTGSCPGYRICFIRYFANDITIIVLSNNESNSLLIGGVLACILKDKLVVLPYKHTATLIDTSLLEKYVGRYRIENIPSSSSLRNVPVPTIIVVFKKGGKLMYRFEKETTEIELRPESINKFFTAEKPDVQIEFEFDQFGEVSKAFYIVHGMGNEIKKLF